MDRRQKRSRNAIFKAFIQLLSEKSYDRITVGEIITRADVGRATFYAHFETKEYLLKALCRELFAHVFEASMGEECSHSHLFDCDAPSSVFLHLLQHLQRNDNHVLELLSCRNDALFLDYFREELKDLVKSQLPQFAGRKSPELPEDFWIDHIAATFVATVRWWVENGAKQSPEEIARYFFLSV